jgi:hypothetical protein
MWFPQTGRLTNARYTLLRAVGIDGRGVGGVFGWYRQFGLQQRCYDGDGSQLVFISRRVFSQRLDRREFVGCNLGFRSLVVK